MSLITHLLDRSVVFSFDASGFRRRAAHFRADDIPDRLDDLEVVVTGANSGLGYATTVALSTRGARVHMLCRNRDRGEKARAEIAARGRPPKLHVVDVGDPESVRRWCASPGLDRVDVLVHNAGALLDERNFVADGLETTVATHVVGPLRLTAGLLPRMSPGSRVVWVSSGGMYSRRLSVSNLARVEGPFNGVTVYADCKRAQVVLSEQLADRLKERGITSNAMHPGWAKTPGVAKALPLFNTLTQRILRTPAQGADTIVWLAVCPRAADHTGLFWLDREAVPTHLRRGTRETEQERTALWEQAWAWAAVEPV